MDIQPPPGLDMPIGLDIPIPHPEEVAPVPELPVQGGDTIVDKDIGQPVAAYKPTHRLTSKQQSPPNQVREIVAQLDDIEKTKEISLENNEDKEEKRQMESIM
eukprot:2693991-Amphidinium_carterae.1